MPTVQEILPGKISLDIECVDRVYLNGYVKDLQMAGGVVNFIREQFNWPIPSPKAMYELTEKFKKAVEAFAQEMGRDIYIFSKGEDKDEVARQHAELFGISEGVVLIGKAQEKANAFRSKRQDQKGKVWFNYFRQNVQVTHFYFYIRDKDFGLCFIKVCTYLPFEVKVCFNGHEWAKQQLRQEGIAFEALSNGFANCAEPERLQAICHQLDAAKIQAFFDHWVEQIPWPLNAEQRAAGYAHLLSIWQMEVSRTQVFADSEQGRALMECLIRDNLDLGRPDRVSLIFDRQVTKRTPSEFHTRVLREGVLPSIRIRYKHSALKQYFKDGRALRTEMMFNNPYDFNCQRSLSNFDRLWQLGRQINQRLLEQETISQDCFLPWDEVRQLQQSTLTETGQRASALHFAQPRVMAWLAALVYHAHRPTTLRNRALRQTVIQLLGASENDYTTAQATYDLRRLRLKGVIERIPQTHTYRLTELGAKAATFLTKLYERLYRPGLTASLPLSEYPSDLAQALNEVAALINVQLKQAALIPTGPSA
jgi:DNA-binding HxlR family transcriptional regulator